MHVSLQRSGKGEWNFCQPLPAGDGVLCSCSGVQGLVLLWEGGGVRGKGQGRDGGSCLLAATVRSELGTFTLISSSETVRTSSTKSRMMGHVFGPMLVLTASAMVSGR